MPDPLILLAIAAVVASGDSKPKPARPSGNRPCADVHFFQVARWFFALLESRGRLQPNIEVADKGTLLVWSPKLYGWRVIMTDLASEDAALQAAVEYVDEQPVRE